MIDCFFDYMLNSVCDLKHEDSEVLARGSLVIYHFPDAVTKCSDKSNLRGKGSVLVHNSGNISSWLGGQGDKSLKEVVTSHLQLGTEDNKCIWLLSSLSQHIVYIPEF